MEKEHQSWEKQQGRLWKQQDLHVGLSLEEQNLRWIQFLFTLPMLMYSAFSLLETMHFFIWVFPVSCFYFHNNGFFFFYLFIFHYCFFSGRFCSCRHCHLMFVFEEIKKKVVSLIFSIEWNWNFLLHLLELMDNKWPFV